MLELHTYAYGIGAIDGVRPFVIHSDGGIDDRRVDHWCQSGIRGEGGQIVDRAR